MKIKYSDTAKNDLKKISNWIAEENPVRARSFVQELAATCDGLLHVPLSNQSVGMFHEQTVRRKVSGNYLIFYFVRNETLEIVRILHGAQDYADLF